MLPKAHHPAKVSRLAVFCFTSYMRLLTTVFVLLIATPLILPPVADARKSDEKLAFGRIKLSAESGDVIELDNPGIFHSGDLFLMWIVPETGEKATRFQVDESGEFFWKLAPGNYVVASYEWSRNAGVGRTAASRFAIRHWALSATSGGTVWMSSHRNRPRRPCFAKSRA